MAAIVEAIVEATSCRFKELTRQDDGSTISRFTLSRSTLRSIIATNKQPLALRNHA